MNQPPTKCPINHPTKPTNARTYEQTKQNTKTQKQRKKSTRPYSVRKRGAPTSVFLAEVARREAEAREAAKVDPWQSLVEEEERAEATVAQLEEEDPLRGERMHAWVRKGIRIRGEQGKGEGGGEGRE